MKSLTHAAVVVLLDRAAVAKATAAAASGQTVIPAVGIQFPKLPGYNANVHGYSYNSAQAKDLATNCSFQSLTLGTYVPADKAYATWLSIYNQAVADSIQ